MTVLDNIKHKLKNVAIPIGANIAWQTLFANVREPLEILLGSFTSDDLYLMIVNHQRLIEIVSDEATSGLRKMLGPYYKALDVIPDNVFLGWIADIDSEKASLIVNLPQGIGWFHSLKQDLKRILKEKSSTKKLYKTD